MVVLTAHIHSWPNKLRTAGCCCCRCQPDLHIQPNLVSGCARKASTPHSSSARVGQQQATITSQPSAPQDAFTGRHCVLTGRQVFIHPAAEVHFGRFGTQGSKTAGKQAAHWRSQPAGTCRAACRSAGRGPCRQFSAGRRSTHSRLSASAPDALRVGQRGGGHQLGQHAQRKRGGLVGGAQQVQFGGREDALELVWGGSVQSWILDRGKCGRGWHEVESRSSSVGRRMPCSGAVGSVQVGSQPPAARARKGPLQPHLHRAAGPAIHRSTHLELGPQVGIICQLRLERPSKGHQPPAVVGGQGGRNLAWPAASMHGVPKADSLAGSKHARGASGVTSAPAVASTPSRPTCR